MNKELAWHSNVRRLCANKNTTFSTLFTASKKKKKCCKPFSDNCLIIDHEPNRWKTPPKKMYNDKENYKPKLVGIHSKCSFSCCYYCDVSRWWYLLLRLCIFIFLFLENLEQHRTIARLQFQTSVSLARVRFGARVPFALNACTSFLMQQNLLAAPDYMSCARLNRVLYTDQQRWNSQWMRRCFSCVKSIQIK